MRFVFHSYLIFLVFLIVAISLLAGCAQTAANPKALGTLRMTLPHNGETVALTIVSNTSWSETHNGGIDTLAGFSDADRRIQYASSTFASYGGFSAHGELNYSDAHLQYQVEWFRHNGGGPSVEQADYRCVKGTCDFPYNCEKGRSVGTLTYIHWENGSAQVTYYSKGNNTQWNENLTDCPSIDAPVGVG